MGTNYICRKLQSWTRLESYIKGMEVLASVKDNSADRKHKHFFRKYVWFLSLSCDIFNYLHLGYDHKAYMDYMDLAVRCPQKGRWI